MGLLDNYTGIGMSPRPKWRHQNVIRQAILNTSGELEEQGLIMLSEATVTDNWDDLAPDLVVFNAAQKPLSVIEITTHKECHAIIRKCDELIVRFPDAEYFVYDYENGLLYGYDEQTDTWLTSDEYELMSRYLRMPLLNYLESRF
jgi:hypothetical protein